MCVAGWILTGLLSGAWRKEPKQDRILGVQETKHGFAQEGIGHCFAAVRLDQFGDPSLIRSGLDAMTRSFNECPPADGFDQVYSPGQKEVAVEADRRANGIPLSGSTVTDLRSLSEEFGVPLKLSE